MGFASGFSRGGLDPEATAARAILSSFDQRSRESKPLLFKGSRVTVAGRAFDAHAAIAVSASEDLEILAGDDEVELLVLQGAPIGEPVVQYGPFVMNTPAEIEEAMKDYRKTRFGGWPFPEDAPTHLREEGRFAKHADGRVERVGH